MNILLGVTGSVAAIKTDKLFNELSKIGEVKIALTKSAQKFVDKIKAWDLYKEYRWKPPLDLTNYYTDEREWMWGKIGDPIQHIELKDWADVFVIAPLTANTLAKMVHGICDNLLTCIYRAYPVNKPLIVAPAMNTDMWNHPLTAEHIESLWNRHVDYSVCKRKFWVVYPIYKKLACGTEGIGAMADIKDIVEMVQEKYDQEKKEKEET